MALHAKERGHAVLALT
ncbi:hypothetical protein ACWDRX_27610, partial [Streptomyces nigra]